MQLDREQGGCIHATMDLFKYAYSIYPLISSDVLCAALNIAIIARKIDMRASPYDVSQYVDDGPIRVETAAGRDEYSRLQSELYELASPVREDICKVYDQLLRV